MSFAQPSSAPWDEASTESSWGKAGSFVSQWYRSDAELLAVLHGVGRADVNLRMLRELKRRLRSGSADQPGTVQGKRHNRLGALARLLDDVCSVSGVTAGERLALFHQADLAPLSTPRRHIGEIAVDIEQSLREGVPVDIRLFRLAEAARRDGLRAKETYAYQLAIHSLDFALALYERFRTSLPATAERSRAYALYDRGACLGALGQFREAVNSLAQAATLHAHWNTVRDRTQIQVVAAEQHRWRAAALLHACTAVGRVSDVARAEAEEIEATVIAIATDAGLDVHRPKRLRFSVADPLYSSPSHLASVIACTLGDLARLWNLSGSRHQAWRLAQQARRLLLLCWEAGVATNGVFARQLAKVADELFLLIRDLRHLKASPVDAQMHEGEGVLAAWSSDEEAEWDSRANAEHTWLGLNRRLRRGFTSPPLEMTPAEFDNAQHLFRFGFSDMVLLDDADLRRLTVILNAMLGSKGPVTVRQVMELLRSGLTGVRVVADSAGLAVARSVLILLSALNGATYPELLRLASLVHKRFPTMDGDVRFCDVAPLLRVQWSWEGERPIPSRAVTLSQLCRVGMYSPDTIERWERQRDAVHRGERPLELVLEVANRHHMPPVVMNVLLHAARSGFATRQEFRPEHGAPVLSDEMADLDRVRTRRAVWLGTYDWARDIGQRAIVRYAQLLGANPDHLTAWLSEDAGLADARLLEALTLVLLDRARAALEPVRAYFWWACLHSGAHPHPRPPADPPLLPTPFLSVVAPSAEASTLGESALLDLSRCLTAVSASFAVSGNGPTLISEELLRVAALAAAWTTEVATYLGSGTGADSSTLLPHQAWGDPSRLAILRQRQETDGSCLRSQVFARAWRYLRHGQPGLGAEDIRAELLEQIGRATFYDALEQGVWAESFEVQERLTIEDLEEPAASFRWADRLLLGDEPAAWAERQLVIALVGLATNEARDEVDKRLERAQTGFRRTGRVGQALWAGLLHSDASPCV